jgi:hypothetical protein
MRGSIRLWGAQPPKEALLRALGVGEDALSKFAVCHIYPDSAGNPRHFTHLGNLVIVPRTLAAFTDWGNVEAVLQRRSFDLSGYRGPPRRPPPEPPHYPRSWSAPWEPADLARTVAELRRLRAERPTWVRAKRPPPAVRPPEGARSLDDEFWASVGGTTTSMFARWVVRHGQFAPASVVAAVPNPFPRCRRIHFGSGERQRDFKDGVFLATNTAAADALFVAIGERLRSTLGGNVNHPWREAPYLPAHFCHLGGLVLVPGAMSSLVDAEPLRALLKRQMFERTGYGGPRGEEPDRSALMPRKWPETVHLSSEQEARALRMLERYRKERPGYYTRPR